MLDAIPVLSNGVNGSAHDDVVMRDAEPETHPTALEADASMSSVTLNGASSTPFALAGPQHDDDQPPPAKRARMHSDADEASLAHVSPNVLYTHVGCANPNLASLASSLPKSATPPPVSAIPSSDSTPAPSFSPTSTLTPAQFKFSQSIVRSLKRLKDAVPFLKPVDYMALNVPHYPTIVKTPMDFSTIERKLASSNPAKQDLNYSNPRYLSADDLINDVRLIFQNCITFNGPDHVIALMGKRVEQVFDRQIKNMPSVAEV